MAAQYRTGKKSPWVVQYRPDHGKDRGRVLTRSFLRKEDAEAFEASLIRKRQLTRAGLEAPAEETLLIDFAKRYIKQQYSENTRSYVDGLERRLRKYWLPEFGTRAIASITSAEITTNLDRIQFDLNRSPAERNRHRALLHSLYELALSLDRVIYNPVSKIPLKKEKSKRPKVILTEEELATYLAGMQAESEQYGMIGFIMAWTGARICTANTLQYRDIDEEAGVVRLCRLEERASKSVVERQKGEDDGEEDAVPLFPALREAIARHRAQAKFKKASDFIACRKDGNYIPYDTLKDVHARVLARTGIRRFTFHDLRRTFATNCKRAGYTRAELREMLGHSSELVTARYDKKDIGHLVEKGKRLGFGADLPPANVVKIRREK